MDPAESEEGFVSLIGDEDSHCILLGHVSGSHYEIHMRREDATAFIAALKQGVGETG